MPNLESLSTEHRKALLGCVKGKVNKWKKENKGSLSQSTTQEFYSECAKALGLEKMIHEDPKPGS